MTASPEPQTPGQVAPVTYKMFTEAQFQALLSTITPGPGFVAQAETVAKTSAEDVLANIKQLVLDAEGTVGHVHGAAKALQADVKANFPLIVIGIVAVAGFVLHFVKIFGFGG